MPKAVVLQPLLTLRERWFPQWKNPIPMVGVTGAWWSQCGAEGGKTPLVPSISRPGVCPCIIYFQWRAASPGHAVSAAKPL